MQVLAYARAPIGACDGIDDERVATNFMFLIAVLVPLDSVYIVGSRLRGKRFQVKRSAKSILLAYARLGTPLLLLFTAVALGSHGEGPLQLSRTAIVALALMTLGWVALIFATGRASGRAARQGRVLRACAGVAVRPEILHDGTLRLAMETLERRWKKAARGEEQYRAAPYRSEAARVVDWRALFPKDIASSTLALYYALCRYEAALTGEPIFANRARIAWERLETERDVLAAALARPVKRPAWLAECSLPEELPRRRIGPWG